MFIHNVHRTDRSIYTSLLKSRYNILSLNIELAMNIIVITLSSSRFSRELKIKQENENENDFFAIQDKL